MSFKVIAPLVIVANDDKTSGDWYGYNGAVVPEGWNDERCKQLVKEGMLENVTEDTSEAKAPKAPKTPGVAEILAEVGDDKVKAQAALDAEREERGDKARKTLVEPLEAILLAEES